MQPVVDIVSSNCGLETRTGIRPREAAGLAGIRLDQHQALQGKPRSGLHTRWRSTQLSCDMHRRRMTLSHQFYRHRISFELMSGQIERRMVKPALVERVGGICRYPQVESWTATGGAWMCPRWPSKAKRRRVAQLASWHPVAAKRCLVHNRGAPRCQAVLTSYAPAPCEGRCSECCEQHGLDVEVCEAHVRHGAPGRQARCKSWLWLCRKSGTCGHRRMAIHAQACTRRDLPGDLSGALG
jgi:hypothetical protein